MKIIFTLAVLIVFNVTSQHVYSAPVTNHSFNSKAGYVDKKKEISIGSDRKSGEMQLHLAIGKKGTALITILDEAGKIVLQQTSQVTGSINIIALKNATRLTEGSYTVRLVSNSKTYTTSFVIWK